MVAPSSSRDRLLEAAIRVIEEEGEAGVRVDRVAESAGVAKPSLYHYFGDRDGLIIAAQAARYERALMFVDVNLVLECDTKEEFADRALTSIDSFSAPEGSTRRRLRIQVLGSAVSRPDLQAAIRATESKAVDEVARMLTIAQKLGWVTRAYSASAIVEWWFGLIVGRHLVEDYGSESDADEWRNLTLRAISLLLFDHDHSAQVIARRGSGRSSSTDGAVRPSGAVDPTGAGSSQ